MTTNPDSAIPPSYRAQDTGPQPSQLDVPPPAYTFPETFKIGVRETTGPLVTTLQLQGHLGLLKLFWDLRQKVESNQDDRVPTFAKALEPELRWAWFVTLAMDRFERWVKTRTENIEAEYSQPPIDVVMVWHAYLLNPGWFLEDMTRVQNVGNLAQFRRLTRAIETNTFHETPSERCLQAWVNTTSTPYDPLDSAALTQYRKFQCPQCRKAVNAPFITETGTGYAQKNFAITCPSCQYTIEKGKLGVFKFVRDLVHSTEVPEFMLAGTLYTPQDAMDIQRGALVKNAILRAAPFNTYVTDPKTRLRRRVAGKEYEDKLMVETKGSPAYMKAFSGKHMKAGGGRLLSRIMSAYTDDSIFSVDLVGAVLRQGSFVRKMHDMRWTEPGYFDGPEDEVVLQHCVARYHAFLDLMASSTGAFFVPTLDIDLAWHTHQLFASQYMNDTKTYVGRYVDHDDKVEEEHLSTSFDLTCRAWQSRFHVAYMHCGCPLPGDTLGQKLAAKLKRHSQQQPAFLCPPDNPDILNATHPSDHNSVYAFHHAGKGDAARKKRAAKAAKRRARDEAKVQKGKLGREAYVRGDGHGQAFLVPVPYYYGAGFGGCMAWYGGVGAGGGMIGGGACAGGGSCAAGAGGCAAGGSACGSGGGCGSGGCGGGGGGGGGCGGGGGGGGCGGGGGGCGGGGGGGA
ncbi:hypothetical protein FIBSPDRAFT_800291 [Athelia psychrophila]|uniref:Uncharacterized protein n=1 Tax=Athelia psychrophila TaxID=1759441 RepID=A0A166ABC5_9AGAM|nr:hypothetical protein FIBSPDRAFT_800291 [Fibularhizoctonia sp. CBS 109695]